MEENEPATDNGHAESSNGSAKPQPDAAGLENSAPMDQATVDQWKRWTFSQIDNGRTSEEVIAEMVAGGWDPDAAAALVDEMNRRAEAMWTRSTLAQTPSAIFASRSREPTSSGRFSIVGSIANLVIALYRMLFQDSDDELLPRKNSTPDRGKSPGQDK